MVRRPPFDMASRAFTARLSNADFKLVGIERDAPQAGAEHGLDRDRLAERAAQQLGHVAHQPVDVGELDLMRLLAREREQSRDQRGGALSGLLGRAHGALHARIAGRKPAQREVGVADDRGQQIVEVVRDAAGEPADRFHLLRLAQRVLGALTQRRLLAQLRVSDRLAPRLQNCKPAQCDQGQGGRNPEDQMVRHPLGPLPRDTGRRRADQHDHVLARQPAEREDPLGIVAGRDVSHLCLAPWRIAVTSGPDAGSCVMSSGSVGYQARIAPSWRTSPMV